MSGEGSSETVGRAFWMGLIALSVGTSILAGDGWGWVAFGAPLVVLSMLFAWAVAKRSRELDKPGALDEIVRHQREAREAREHAAKAGEP